MLCRDISNKYKAFLVTNTVTGICFNVTGFGDELPHPRLKSVAMGQTVICLNRKIKQLLEYERIL
jgi:hypothetical protein